MKRFSLKRAAFQATIVSLSVVTVKRMFHVKRPVISISDIIFFDSNQRFSHQYPESTDNTYQNSKTVSNKHSTLKLVPDSFFER